jgi:hypothetical protein
LAAVEFKSQRGPSFGNNFNNRTEEAMGSALDLWTAYREGAFNKTIRPWLGYVFLLEDCEGSRRPVKVREPHFKVFPEFVKAYEPDGMTAGDFIGYGVTQRTLCQFVEAGWKLLEGYK